MSQKKSDQPTSQARIDANRANALNSTGPRSPNGKAASRFNAIKHGVSAKHVCITGENSEDFEALATDLRQHLQPASNYEHRLVDQLITLHWHQIRLRFIQGAHLQIEIQRLDLPSIGMREDIPDQYRIPIAYEKLSETKVLDLANRELTRVSREYDRISRLFFNLRNNPPAAPIEDSESPVQNEPIEAGPAETPVQNEPNLAPAAALGQPVVMIAIPLIRKPQPAEPAPPLVLHAAA